MSAQVFEALKKQADALPANDQLRLAAYLLERASHAIPPEIPHQRRAVQARSRT
jgi:hypothetical protein